MAPRTSPQPQDPAAKTKTPSRARRAASREPAASEQPLESGSSDPAADASTAPEDDGEDIAAELSFREAQTALELSLAELQAPDLDVEQMAGLYQRAQRYAERCETLLRQVEQEVLQWDPEQPQEPPRPYES